MCNVKFDKNCVFWIYNRRVVYKKKRGGSRKHVGAAPILMVRAKG